MLDEKRKKEQLEQDMKSMQSRLEAQMKDMAARYDSEFAKMKTSVKEVEAERDNLISRTGERVNDLQAQITRLNAQSEADKIALKAQV